MSNFEQEIRNKQFKQATGSAPNFRAIDGVGDKTARAVRNVIGIDAPSDAADKTADELAEEAGISESRARKVIRGGGGDPDRTPRSNTGSVSAAGIRAPTGEFKPEIGDKDTAKARFESSINRGVGRSQNAAIADKAKRAPVTTDVERWKENKGELDFPGVDTPTSEPNVLPKDLRQEQRPATTDPPDPPTPRRDDTASALTGITSSLGVSPEVQQTDPTRSFQDELVDPGERRAAGGRRGNVPQGFVDNLASGRKADQSFVKAEQERGSDTPQFDRTVTVGVTPNTLGEGFTIQTDDDRADRALGKGTSVVERVRENVGLPDPDNAESTDVVAEAKIGLQDRDSGFGYETDIVETRKSDDTIFNFR